MIIREKVSQLLVSSLKQNFQGFQQLLRKKRLCISQLYYLNFFEERI